MSQDPFATPGAIPTDFPTVASLRGRLVLIKPLKQETVPNNLGAPGATQERITADVTVVDGLGPVPGMKNGQPTGQQFAGPEFRGMWISSEVVVKQLADALASKGMVLGRIDTRTPGTQPIKGNPWGLTDPSEADKQTARNFLAGQMIGAAAAPAPQPQAAPVYQPAPAMVPQAYAAPQQASPVNVTTGPAPSPGTNPFA